MEGSLMLPGICLTVVLSSNNVFKQLPSSHTAEKQERQIQEISWFQPSQQQVFKYMVLKK